MRTDGIGMGRWAKIAALVVVLAAVLLGATRFSCRPHSDRPGPPETPPGSDAKFDRLLKDADATWAFLFRSSDEIYTVDVAGKRTRLLFDINQPSNLTLLSGYFQMHSIRVAYSMPAIGI